MTNAKQFAIVKPLLSIIGDREDYEALKPITPYLTRRKKERDLIDVLVPGEKPPPITNIAWVFRLPDYKLPMTLENIFDIPNTKKKCQLIRSLIPPELTAQTHSRWFHTLLYAEEYQSGYGFHLYMTQ
jgi:helicase MOV-10